MVMRLIALFVMLLVAAAGCVKPNNISFHIYNGYSGYHTRCMENALELCYTTLETKCPSGYYLIDERQTDDYLIDVYIVCKRID